MNGFHDEVNSSGILRQTKRIVKEDKKYRRFIVTHNRFKRMHFNYNDKLNKLPMLFPYYYNNSLSLRRKGHYANQYTLSRNSETFPDDQENTKQSFEHPIPIDKNLITNNSINNPRIYNHKQFFLLTETNFPSPMNSIINTSCYNCNSFRSYSNHYSFRTTTSFRQHNTNSSFRRFHHDLFQNSRYDSLEYDESLIYGHKEHIYSYIEKKVRELADNSNHNHVEYLDKELTANENKFHIKLNSLNISFYDSKTNELCNEYVLPLALLPIFYSKDVEYFKMLLTKMITFDTSYNSFQIEEKVLFKYLRNIFKMPVILSPIKNNVEIESNHTSNKASPNKLAIKKMNTAHISKHPFSPIFQKKLSIKTGKNKINHADNSNSVLKQIDVELEIPESNSKTIDIYQNKNSSHNNYSFNEKQNIFEFIWITPSKNYKVIIQTPTITLREKTSNLCIHSYINFEFLFYLYRINFSEWDFYCLNYLFSYKQCRQIMNKLLSKLSYVDSLPPVTPNSVIYLNKKQNLIYNTQNCSELKFIASDNGKNCVIVIKPPSFKITLMKFSDNSETDYQNDYVINFNISQAIKLIKSLEIVNSYKLKDLLEKFITVKHNNNLAPKVEFNYNAFDSINEEDWLEMLKGIDKFSNKGEVIDEHLIEFNSNQVEMVSKKATEFVNPCLIKKAFNESGKEIIEQVEYILPLFTKLIKKDISCWPVLCSEVLNVKKKENSETGKVNGIVRRKTFHFKGPVISPKINKKKTSSKA